MATSMAPLGRPTTPARAHRPLRTPKGRTPAGRCTRRTRTAASAGDKDITKEGATAFIDRLTQFIANSPINEGKKMLAKAQAGEYDEERVKEKLRSFIADNDIAMLSFPS